MNGIEQRYTAPECAEIARQHIVTIRLRLESGELHGSQRKVGGRWLVAESCLQAYLAGQKCAHQAAPAGNVTKLRRSA